LPRSSAGALIDDAGDRAGGSSRARSRLLAPAAIAGVWTVLALLAASQAGLARAYDGERVEWSRLVVVTLADWYTCAVFTPVFLWLVRRWPLQRRALGLTLARYAGVTAAMVVLKFALYVPIRHALAPSPDLSLGRVLVGSFFGEFLFFAAVIGIACALEAYRSLVARELRDSQLEARLSLAQLEALRRQIHPHFLFNTLHGISTLMHRDVALADEMLSRLADLLRATLDREGVQEVPLGEELALLERYLGLMQVRFGDRLGVSVDVAPDLREALVPHLLLQPLVENAIQHGIARRAGAGRVSVTARRGPEGLAITVSDDGPGLAPATGEARREGIGLTNTRLRLRELYGDAGSLAIGGGRGPGTEVTVVLPCRMAPAARAEAV